MRSTYDPKSFTFSNYCLRRTTVCTPCDRHIDHVEQFKRVRVDSIAPTTIALFAKIRAYHKSSSVATAQSSEQTIRNFLTSVDRFHLIVNTSIKYRRE